MRLHTLTLALTLASQALLAQDDFRRSMRDCDDSNWGNDREQFCEIREVTLQVPPSGLSVDGRENGGVTFHGWDKNQVLVRARVQSWADSRSEAEAVAKSVQVLTADGRIRAEGPHQYRHASWAVSYEVFVPRKIDLEADTQNGGVSADSIEGRLDFHAVNGGIRLLQVAGDVRGETTNGGVYASLAGGQWKGTGLDLETTNGGVTLEIPRGYNARLETGTVNGSMNIDFPITIQGQLTHRLRTTLGTGGALIRATTTNGGVRIRQR